MNIDDLRIFCQVVEIKNLSEVARLNYLSQPAITQKMYKLEKLYGAQLFKREAGKISITENAYVLYPYAKSIIRKQKESQQALHDHLNETNEKIFIGASFTIGEYIIPKIIQQFKEKYDFPLKFELMIDNSPTILKALERDTLDIALLESQETYKSLHKTAFKNDDLIFVCSSNHPLSFKQNVTIDDFLNETMIWREKESSMRKLIEKSIPNVQNTIELNSIQAIKNAVIHQLGVTILPKVAVEHELHFGLLKELSINHFHIERQLFIVERPHTYQSNIVTSFKRYLSAYFK